MSFRERLGAPSGPAKRQEHRPYRFLVDTGLDDYEHVHCPVCRSQNAGWTSQGEPVYSGGVIDAIVPHKHGQGSYGCVAACLCREGRDRHVRQHLRYFTELPPTTGWITQPGLIVWVDNQGQQKPKSPPRKHPHAHRFVELGMQQVKRLLAKEINNQQFNANMRALEDRYGMPKERLGPSIDDLLRSQSLFALYLPEAEAAAERPAPTVADTAAEEPSRLPYKDN